MILYGRYVSPFVRRVGVWLGLQGREYEHRPLLVAGDDLEKIRAQNPVARVPILILDDGTRLIESFAICDYLDETAPAGKRLIPASGAARLDCMQRMAMGQSTAEKAVALVYEKNRRPEEYQWPEWRERLTMQVRGGLAELDRLVPEDGWSGESGMDGGDIAAAVAYHFAEFSNPWLLEPGYPRLAALAERAMGIDAYARTKPEA